MQNVLAHLTRTLGFALYVWCSTLLMLFLALAAIPQLGPGDVVVTCTSPGHGVYAVKPDGSVGTLAAPAIDFPNAVTVAPDNEELVVAYADVASNYGQNPIVRIAPDGLAVGTLAATSNAIPHALDLDAQGRVLAFTSTANRVMRVSALGGGLTTTAHRLSTGVLNAGAHDPRTGGTILAAYWSLPGGGILRSDPGGALTTLAWGLGRVTGVAADVFHGGYVVTRRDAPEVLRVRENGTVTTVASMFDASAVAVDADGTIWVTGANRVTQFSSAGTPVRSAIVPGQTTSLALYGRRTLVSRGTPRPGGRITIDVASLDPLDGNQPYVLAASTGFDPAVRLPDGRRFPLAPTPLFVASVGGLLPFLRGFQGRLDGLGRATAHIDLPPGLPPLDLAIAGVVVDTRANRIATLLGPIGVHVSP